MHAHLHATNLGGNKSLTLCGRFKAPLYRQLSCPSVICCCSISSPRLKQGTPVTNQIQGCLGNAASPLSWRRGWARRRAPALIKGCARHWALHLKVINLSGRKSGRRCTGCQFIGVWRMKLCLWLCGLSGDPISSCLPAAAVCATWYNAREAQTVTEWI